MDLIVQHAKYIQEQNGRAKKYTYNRLMQMKVRKFSTFFTNTNVDGENVQARVSFNH